MTKHDPTYKRPPYKRPGLKTARAAARRAEEKRRLLKEHIRMLQDRLDTIERALRHHLLNSDGQTSLDEFIDAERSVKERK